MHTLILLLGIGCTAYFLAELIRLARAATVATRFAAADRHTGRRLRLRLDRRLRERRGDRRPRF